MVARRPLLAFLALALALALAFSFRGSAQAHPLGNFAISHSTTIEVAETGVTVARVLDLAEIPAFNEQRRIDTNNDGTVDDTEYDTWSVAKAAELAAGMNIAINGDRLTLQRGEYLLTFPEGEGGLVILRFEVTYTAALPEDWSDATASLTVEDTNYSGRVGWREIIARGGPGVTLVGSSLPTESPTKRLLVFSDNALASPQDVRAASFSFEPGDGGVAPAPEDPDEVVATRGNPDGSLVGFTKLISEKELSAPFIVIALLTAMAFGAIHALSPGHGKTIVAAYLVGSRGTIRHAALLGVTVTVTHTSSVYALGFVTLYLSRYIVPEDLYPWMGVFSGAIIIVMGLSLLATRLRQSGALTALGDRLRNLIPGGTGLALAGDTGSLAMWPSHQHGEIWHDHTAVATETVDHHHHADLGHHEAHTAVADEAHVHDSGGEHSHGFGPAHSHAIPGADGEPVTWQRLLGLGIFGGMIPCPSAIVVMLSAIALHRVGFGLVLILAFSIGLATVLTLIGFMVVWAQRVPFLQRAMDRADNSSGLASLLVRGLPVAAAILVTLAGVVITSRAAGQF